MVFDEEPGGYEKTVLSDLQGAWQNLRHALVEHAGFPGWERGLFHIDEGMSWESVRDLRYMRGRLLLVRNILLQGKAPDEIRSCLDEVSAWMDEALLALQQGRIS